MRAGSILILVTFVTLLNCKPDLDTELTGKLEVSFVNSSELTLDSRIYEISNLNYPLFPDLKADGSGKLTVNQINFGNYIIEYFVHDDINGGNFGQRKAFQITPDRTTTFSITL